MESSADKIRAFVYALLVHLVIVGLMFAGLFWTRSAVTVAIPGPIIEATLVGPAQAPKPRASRKPTPPKPVVEPKPEPPKPDDATPTPPRPDTKDQERVAALAAEKAEAEAKEQQERQKQEQILLEEEAKKKAKLEKERLAQLEDQKKRDQARMQELLEADEAKTGQEGVDDSLEAQYFAAIQNAVTNAWLRPDSTQPGLRCMVRIVQIPGGDVLDATVTAPCNADPVTRNSLEQAVKRAAPLPYTGYEKVFRRSINFNFMYNGQ
jgi:colicin import membrane protein